MGLMLLSSSYLHPVIVSPKKHYRPSVRTQADIGQVPKEGWRQEGHPASKTSCFISQCMDSFCHSTITLGAAKRADIENGSVIPWVWLKWVSTVHVWHTVQPVHAWKAS